MYEYLSLAVYFLLLIFISSYRDVYGKCGTLIHLALAVYASMMQHHQVACERQSYSSTHGIHAPVVPIEETAVQMPHLLP